MFISNGIVSRLYDSANVKPNLAKRSLALSTALVGWTLLCGAPAFAQETPEPQESDTPDRVVVTAQFREQALEDTPIAITAMDSELLEARSQTNIIDIAAQAPNVVLQQPTSQIGPAMQAFIRGIGQSDFNFAFEPGVGIYIDDVYFSSLTGSLLDLLDVDRVEVLRGPQGTLAGMNNIGGSIKMFSKPARGDGDGFVEITYGEYDRTDVRAGADFTVIPDQLYGRISGVSRSQEGYVTRYDFACTHPGYGPTYQLLPDCKLGTEGGKAYTAARLALRWTPTDRFTLDFSADNTDDDSESAAQTLIFVGSLNTTSTANPNSSFVTVGSTVNAWPYSRSTQVDCPAIGPSCPFRTFRLWDTATASSQLLSYTPYSNMTTATGVVNVASTVGDTFSRSPYINYTNYLNPAPSDGTPPWAAVPKAEVDSWGVSLRGEYEFSDSLKLTNIMGYRRYEAYWAQDPDASPFRVGLLTYDLEHHQFSEEIRLAGTLFNEAVDWVLGYFYFDQFSAYRGRNDLGNTGAFLELDSIPATNSAIFGNLSVRPIENLEVNLGIRRSNQEKTFEFGRGGLPGATTSPAAPTAVYAPCIVNGVNYGTVNTAFCSLNGASGSFEGDNTDYRLAVQYRWTPDIMTYASYATGFKGGGINPRPFQADQATPFDPETVDAYEVGVKSSWFNRRVSTNLSLFLNNYTSIITGVTISPPAAGSTSNPGCVPNPNQLTGFCSFYTNAGDAEMKGAELEVFAEPIDGLLIDLSVSYLDFEYKTLTGCTLLIAAGQPGGCAAGQVNSGGWGAGIRPSMRTTFAPEMKYSLGIQYNLDLGNLGVLSPRVDFSHQDELYTGVVNHQLNTLPERDLVNARLTYRPPGDEWTASVQVTNLTDEVYYTGLQTQANPGIVQGAIAPPSQWSVTLKRVF